MGIKAFLSKLNIRSRQLLGSAGPVSPGRMIVTGAATYGTITFATPRVMTWLGREVWSPSATVLWGSIAATVVFVEGVCYLWGDDPEVHASATVAAFRELAADYLQDAARERALARMSGMSEAEIHDLLLSMSMVQSPAPAAAEERRAANG